MKLKKCFYGAYGVSKTGIVIRLKGGIGARPGYRLQPYYPAPHCNMKYVDLQYGGKRLQIAIDNLIKKVWG